ncbi:unnamed protein product [Cladocopium goreaui]|uniref:Kinase protein n=1 Tax=Cladocopium goreaui TaxID=2562237 RepID=A0A9P1CZU2_9DINO|nr:unnamed protein product [Cladocopium goreaui]
MAAVAGVIGNWHYDCHKPLPSCHKDAEEISKGLRSGQFPGEATEVYYDADRNTILQAINRLSEAVRSGARFTWFHYSGHGIWYQDDLHLVPSDSRYFEANVPVSSILESLSKHETQGCLHIITLDCCQTLRDHTDVSSSTSCRGKMGGKKGELWKRIYSFSPSASGHEVVVFFACEKCCAVPDREDHLPNCKLGYFIGEVTQTVTQETRETNKKQVPTLCHLGSCPKSFFRNITTATQADEVCVNIEQKIQKLMMKGLGGVALLTLDNLLNMSTPRENDPFLIVLDGNIGCGKTTLLADLSMSLRVPGIQICPEPVPEHETNTWWHLLEKFYNAIRTGESIDEAVIELENAIWQHHFNIATNRSTPTITERGCASAVLVFCKALLEDGILSDRCFQEFMEKLERVHQNCRNDPTLILYFKMPVEEAMPRIQKRAQEGRHFELGMPEPYLKKLDVKYDSLYKNREDVITVDASMSTDEIKRTVADQLHQNQARYCELFQRKGYPEDQARELPALMMSCFSN